MYRYAAKLNRVVDGDNIRCDISLGFNIWLYDQNIRLYGIDAPESRTSDPIEKVYGKLAKQYLIDNLPEQFILQTHKDGKGKYGRILGELITYVPEMDREMSLNKVMIMKNLVVEYHGQSKKDIADQHIANRKILQEQGVVSVSPDYR